MEQDQRIRTAAAPRLAVVYLYPLDAGDTFVATATRWANGYKHFKPAIPHTLYICFSNGDITEEVGNLFLDINHETIMFDGGGWDIGAYQHAAVQLKDSADLCVFMNCRAFPWRAGWLERFRDAWLRHGDGLFGATASYERCPLRPTTRQRNPHIRTACFACSPRLLAAYPYRVDSREKGFRFESGDWNFARWFEENGYPVLLVTWNAEWTRPQWRTPPNIFRRGDQTNCLVWDRHTAAFADANSREKQQLSDAADNG